MEPLTMALISGGLSAGSSALSAGVGFAGKKQQYASDKAFQSADSRFANWQAGFTARVNDANSQHEFWKDTVNYNQNLAFAHSQRNVELMKSIDQAKVVAETRRNAGVSYVQDAQAISDGMREVEMNAAVSQQQYQWRALHARASVQAMAMEGNSVDRIINDYSRQEGDMMVLEAINSDIRSRQYTRAQAGQVQQYLSRWNSQTFYNEAQVFDPIPPFAPLPSLITPPPPSRTGAPPSAGAFAMQLGSAVLGGAATGVGMYAQVEGLKTPSTTTGPGTTGTTGTK